MSSNNQQWCDFTEHELTELVASCFEGWYCNECGKFASNKKLKPEICDKHNIHNSRGESRDMDIPKFLHWIHGKNLHTERIKFLFMKIHQVQIEN